MKSAFKIKAYILLKYIIYFSLIIFSSHSFADSLTCNETSAVITDAKSTNEAFFNLTIKNSLINKSYHYDIQKDYINIRCEKTSAGSFVFLINHFCGGSGCADLANFGIINAKTGAVLLEPDKPFKGNTNKAKQIMGKEIKPFTCSKDSGEICLHSKISLG